MAIKINPGGKALGFIRSKHILKESMCNAAERCTRIMYRYLLTVNNTFDKFTSHARCHLQNDLNNGGATYPTDKT